VDPYPIVAAGAGAGLRWGEAAGLPWGAVDLVRQELRVVQVAIETAAGVTVRSYPKSRQVSAPSRCRTSSFTSSKLTES
jgi:hypothetical protein